MKAALRVALLLGGMAAAVAIGLFWPPANGWLRDRLVSGAASDARLVLYGNVDIREVALAFRQGGRVAEMAAEEGDAVQAGDVVAVLDDRPLRDAAARAEAERAQAQASLDRLRNGNRPQEIAEAAALLAQAEATLRFAEIDYRRKRSLVGSRVVSESESDAARAARDEAAAVLEARRQALALLEAGARAEDIAAGEAALAAAGAARDQARTALEDARLAAPAAGTILARILEPGSMAAAGTPVYTLSLKDPVYVRAYVAEPDLGRAVPGAAVRVTTDSGGRVYDGRIGFVSPRAEFTPKSVETTALRTDLVYRLRIVVTDADDGLRQGMPVTVTLDREG
ncbi:secretion protein HlyD [uncultured Tistrella sp.]|uniref:secretion protein HlyD n=1 Tax=Tistrella mobilis TaxID=171437 RepID=UPI000C0ADFFB|nr:secretion protein HlyD [uncultured Tistrella sp.]MAM72480.1 secretion protein HlyD [Tistrella sp.]